MAEWCADNLRDLAGWKAAGLEMTSPSNEDAKLLDGAIRQMVSWRDCDQLGGIGKTFENLKKAEPGSAMVEAFLLCLDAMGTGKATWTDEQFKKDVEACEEMAKSTSINERERKHLKAAALWARGFMPEAERVWEEILLDHPNDLIAVKLVHDSYFFSGNPQGKRDCVARVLPKWKKDEPCRSYLHGMHAFGLEECFQYEEAEKEALLALSLRKEDCWATHARAHVMEMQGRLKEGREFLDGTVQDWEPGWMLACHTYWHRSLFSIEEGEYETSLTLFDKQVGRRAVASWGMLDNVDAASLLWRLELEGVNVGDRFTICALFDNYMRYWERRIRWQRLPDVSTHLHDHVISFNDAHFAFSLHRAGRIEQQRTLTDSLKEFVKNGTPNNNRMVAEVVGESLCDGMVAFADENYDKAVEKLMPVRKQIYRIGGSHAQNDIFTQTLIHACLRTGKDEHKKYARTLLEEREKIKTHSIIAARLSEQIGDAKL